MFFTPSKILDPYLASILKQISFIDPHNWSQSSKCGREGVEVILNFLDI